MATAADSSPGRPSRRIAVVPVNFGQALGGNGQDGDGTFGPPMQSPAANTRRPALGGRRVGRMAITPSSPRANGADSIRRQKTPRTPHGLKSSRSSGRARRQHRQTEDSGDASIVSTTSSVQSEVLQLQRRAEEIFAEYRKEQQQHREKLNRHQGQVAVRAREKVLQRALEAAEGACSPKSGNAVADEAALREQQTGTLSRFLQEALTARQDQLDGADVARQFWDDIDSHLGEPELDSPRSLPWNSTKAWVDGHPKVLPTASFDAYQDDPPISPPAPLRSGRLHKAVGDDYESIIAKSATYGASRKTVGNDSPPRAASPRNSGDAQIQRKVTIEEGGVHFTPGESDSQQHPEAAKDKPLIVQPKPRMTSRRRKKKTSQKRKPSNPSEAYMNMLKQVGFSSLCFQHVLPGLPQVLRVEPSFLEFKKFGMFCKALPYMQEVRSLSLVHILLPEEILNAVIVASGNLKNLEELDISGNEFGATTVENLGALLSSKSPVKKLCLSQLKIGDALLSRLVEDIHGNSLVELDLSHNRIGDAQKAYLEAHESLAKAQSKAPALGKLIRNSPNLQTLDLTRNRIRYCDSCSIAHALMRSPSLTSLILDHNPIGDLGSQYIASSLRKNSKLKKLDLAFSTVSPMGAFVFKNVLTYYNTTLVELNLSGNDIGKQVLAELVAGIVTRNAPSDAVADPLDSSNFKLHLEHCGDCPVLHDLTTPPPRQDFNLAMPYERALVLEFMQMAHVQVNSIKLKAVYLDAHAIARLERHADDSSTDQPVQLMLFHDDNLPKSPLHKTSSTKDPAPPRFKRRRQLVEGMINEGLVTVAKLEAFFDTMQLRPDRALTRYIIDMFEDTTAGVHDFNGDAFLEAVLEGLWLALVDVLDGNMKYVPAMRPPEPPPDDAAAEGKKEKESGKKGKEKATVPAHETTAAHLRAKKEAERLAEALKQDRLQRIAARTRAMERILDGEMLKRAVVLLGHPRVADESLITRLLWHHCTSTEARNTALTHRVADTDLVGINRRQLLNHLIETANYESDELHTDVQPVETVHAGGGGEKDEHSRTSHLQLTDLATLELWKLPHDGYLTLFMKRENSSAVGADPFFRHETPAGGFRTLVDIIRNVADADDQAHLLEFVTSSSSTLAYNAEQAVQLCDACYRIPMEYRLERILPEMTHFEEAIQVMASLTPHIDDRMQLRLNLGSLWKPTFGLTGGHYHLDMAQDLDRLTAIKLAEVAHRERLESEYYAHRGDTSQNGNWENYRNCYYNGRPCLLTVKWFQTMPRTGIVTFDYVSTYRTPSAIQAIGSVEFLHLLDAMHEATCEFNFNRLHEKHVDFSDSEDSYDEQGLDRTHDAVEPAPRTERTSVVSATFSFTSMRSLEQLDLSGPLASAAKLHYDYMDISDHVHCSEIFKHHVKSDLPPSKKHFEQAFSSLYVVEILAVGEYFLASQVAELVHRLPNEQYVRVELLISLLPRIVDLQNLHLVIEQLNEKQWHEARYRMGALNLGNCASAFASHMLRFEVPRCKDDLVLLNVVRHHKFKVEEKFKFIYEAATPKDAFEHSKHNNKLKKMFEADLTMKRYCLASSAPYRSLRAVRKKEYKIKDAIMRVGTRGGMSEEHKEMHRETLTMGSHLKEFLENRQEAAKKAAKKVAVNPQGAGSTDVKKQSGAPQHGGGGAASKKRRNPRILAVGHSRPGSGSGPPDSRPRATRRPGLAVRKRATPP